MLYSKIVKWGSVLVVGVLAVVGAGVIYAHGDTSQHPGKPSDVVVSAIGDTEATISWTAPTSGDCFVTDYQVHVGDVTVGNEVQSPFLVTGLDPSTEYTVAVWSYGLVCDDYSEEAAYGNFSTASSDEGSAATPVKKHAPRKVKNLNVSAGEVVRWSPPSTKGGRFQEATGYKVVVEHRVNGERVRVYDTCENNQCSDLITTTNHLIPSGKLDSGSKYSVRVAAYSKDCNCWGKWRTVKHTA